jgi:hypothetical protein
MLGRGVWSANSSRIVEAGVKDNQVRPSGATFSRASSRHLKHTVTTDTKVKYPIVFNTRGLVPSAQASYKAPTVGVALPVNRAATDDDYSLGYHEFGITLKVRGCGAKATGRRSHAGSAVPLD